MFVNILPPEVRQKIAAGEIIEGPVDVVKELVENSLDAEATEIEVEIFGGGKRYIKVKDNGKGIHPEDIEKVILEGATSKISSEKDIYNVLSYGFRGEALYAISSVSLIKIRSRYFQEDVGYEIEAEAGKVKSKKTTGMPTGTTVEVRELFFNLPVRRKFLRKADTERRKIKRSLLHYALANPGVGFKLVSEGKSSLELRRADPLSRIEEVFEKKFEEVKGEITPVRVDAYISRNTERSEIFIFINSRPVFNRSYKDFLKKVLGYKTIGIVFISMPPYLVEQNIHPKKQEVRVVKERKFLEALRRILTGKEIELDFMPLLKQEEPIYSEEPEVVGQLGNTFIVARLGEYVYFFDQHLLSERLNYEALGEKETLANTACRTAIKKGESLSIEEMKRMVKEWLRIKNPHVCPHGRPIYYRIPFSEILSKVDRRVK